MDRPPSFADLDAAIAALGYEARQTRPRKAFLELVARGRQVHRIAQEHRARFAAMPDFDIAALDQIPEMIERMEQAEIAWFDQRIARRHRSSSKTREEAIALRFKLLSTARYVLRPFPSGLDRRFEGFYRRRNLAHVIADLLRLADLVDEHPKEFADVPGLPPNPAQVAREIQEKLVRGSADSHFYDSHGDRNAWMALLELALQEVGSAARYLFRYEPEILDSLADEALRKSKKRRRKARQRAAKKPALAANG